jgi:hypothetical protein
VDKLDLLAKFAIANDAPADMRQSLEACAQEMNREIRHIRLDAPDTETLQKMLTAGPGEHQDRLFTSAVKKAVVAFLDRLETIKEAHKAQWLATRGQDGKGPVDRFLS